MQSVESAAVGVRAAPPAAPVTPVTPVAAQTAIRGRGIGVGIAAGVSLLLYLGLLGVIPGLAWSEPTYAFEVIPWAARLPTEALDALKTQGGLVGHTNAAIGFGLLVLGLAAAYAVTLWLVRGARSRRLEGGLFGAGALFLLLQLTGPAMLSNDVYAYIVYGRIFAVYHSDPYSSTPILPAGDPYVPLWDLHFLPSWYGQLWTLLSGGLAALGGLHIGLTVLLFRGFAVLATLVCAGLIWACLRRFAPERTALGLVFFLWNPLIILETGLSGHNDTVMMALFLLGIWLALTGRRVLAVQAMVLSVLIKFLTGLAFPLYVLLMLRQLPTWGARGRYLALSGALGLVVAAAVFGLAGSVETPVAQAQSDTGFYSNNIHELIFKQLRVWLGEDAESIQTPIYFKGWWVTPKTATALRNAPDPAGPVLEQVGPGRSFFVITPQKTDWARVYDVQNRRKGYLFGADVALSKQPAGAGSDPVLAQYMLGQEQIATVVEANSLLRISTLLAFGVLWLLTAWRAATMRGLLVGSTIVLLASYWLVVTEIWPWYAIWALALAALVSDSRPARLAAILSVTALSLYITGGFQSTTLNDIYVYRALPAFALPLVLWLVGEAILFRLRPAPASPLEAAASVTPA